ncbi:MAG: hypothetical protein Q3971_02965 [Moraxella sp.]|nr:hypothetical protein [Moraxella sp.]
MNVIFSASFQVQFPTLTNAEKQAILAFVRHVEQHGLKGLTGRNKSSTPQNPHTKKERANHAHAQKHCLWHYHIGIPHYVGDDGIKLANISYITKDLMIRLCYWTYPPTHRLHCQRWNNLTFLQG